MQTGSANFPFIPSVIPVLIPRGTSGPLPQRGTRAAPHPLSPCGRCRYSWRFPSKSGTHTAIPGGRICSFYSSLPASDPIPLPKSQALLCQAPRALLLPKSHLHSNTSASMQRQALIPQPPTEPTLIPEHLLPLPGAHSRCSSLPSAVSRLSLSHSPSLCATSSL